MRFGTFFFFRAPAGHPHPDIIHRELIGFPLIVDG